MTNNKTNINCWYNLKIDTTNAIRKDWNFIPPGRPLSVKFVTAPELFNQEWLSYMQSLGLSVVSALVFYRGANANAPTAHVDLTNIGKVRPCSFGINWTLGGAGSEMVWYDMPKTGHEVKYTEANNPFMDWPFTDLTEIDRTAIGSNNATLVRVGYPHTIEMKDDPRWCISARTLIREDLPWPQIVEKLRSKNLLVERTNE